GFQFIEHRLAKPSGEIAHQALDHSAQRITVRTRPFDQSDHGFGSRLVRAPDRCRFNVPRLQHRLVYVCLHVMDLRHVSDDLELWEEADQQLARYGPSGDTAYRLTRTGTAATLPIANSILCLVREIG